MHRWDSSAKALFRMSHFGPRQQPLGNKNMAEEADIRSVDDCRHFHVPVSQARNFAAMLIPHMLKGIGSGASNVTLMGLLFHYFSSKQRDARKALFLSEVVSRS
jgi:hypothetical protein